MNSEGETLKIIADEELARVTSRNIANKLTDYMRLVVTDGTGKKRQLKV